ncbi:nuclear transport factor 2 family protein [Mycobacterium sp. CBMA271]|uniref:nuclear transport factor 2 family protein n=1 Tax=unclassified Mycobacteroides TaxID=2618759 RepID=UPI0012DE3A5B|nr:MULTISPECIES: nuclear transport factor 2 family protein [unclassified Mycobacteroides]MUM18906.1 hypothetical protein [Mycobacteroides sp. CBMA 326]MUM23154.1 nuclear transport factor 2 family protein [Mycobacteroides sp. CBMA 271]
MTDHIQIRESNKESVVRALAGITALDINKVRAELHETLFFRLPYEEAVPDLDRDGFIQLLEGIFATFDKFEITVTQVFDLLDPTIVIATYTGDCSVRGQGTAYRNEYIGLFELTDGLIARWQEYDNPVVVSRALAALSGQVVGELNQT